VFGIEPPPDPRTIGSLLVADPSGRGFAEQIHMMPGEDCDNVHGAVPRIRTVSNWEMKYSDPWKRKDED
jgi:hypothetical protein